jgi:hypothetical protein
MQPNERPHRLGQLLGARHLGPLISTGMTTLPSRMADSISMRT